MDETPEKCRESRKVLTDVVLKTDSQPEAFQALEEALVGE